jgi:hypothetical protein
MKHTPGPWSIDGYGHIIGPDKQHVLISGVTSPMVPTVESKANTLLVAAAPHMEKDLAIAGEMYAALTLVFDTFSAGTVKAAERDKALEAAASALARWEERDWSVYDPREATIEN